MFVAVVVGKGFDVAVSDFGVFDPLRHDIDDILDVLAAFLEIDAVNGFIPASVFQSEIQIADLVGNIESHRQDQRDDNGKITGKTTHFYSSCCSIMDGF